jgi:hypothetical protein
MTLPTRTIDPTTLPDIDIGTTTIEVHEPSMPCMVHDVASEATECPEQATHIVMFKPYCDHGGSIPLGDPELCEDHMLWLMTGRYRCGGCNCPVHLVGGYKHLINGARPLK